MKMNDLNNRVKWQIDCDRTIKYKNNVILSSPTGSGKTGRYEIWALNKEERPIFITSPIKALSNQKFRSLYTRGYKVGLETGDIKYMPYKDCDIICCTQEIYNNRYRDYEDSTLIVDEFSYIFDDCERARAYIDSLMYSKATNIMICSATFGDLENIQEYINKITKRNFFVYENNDRLTSLEYVGKISKNDIKDSLVVAYSKNSCQLIAKDIYKYRSECIERDISYYGEEQLLRNKKEIIGIAKKCNINNKELLDLSFMGVVYYYGGLFPKEKMFIEELFEKRLIDTVVGTDALALGVNFPIRNVIYTQLIKKGNNGLCEISKNLFEQLSGRAGRKGYFDKGYVYYCSDFDNYIYNEKGDNLEVLFNKLVSSSDEKILISLTANIKDILLNYRTIEEEADFVVRFSMASKDYLKELRKIERDIDYIRNFDLSVNYLKWRYQIDISDGFYKAIEHLTQEKQVLIEKLTDGLLKLQPYFEKDIGVVYLNEYSTKQNCNIFMDILLEVPLEKLIRRYGKSLYDLLILRKYMYGLPEKYRKNYNLEVLDKKIDNMDYSVLHPNKFSINEEIVKEKRIDKKNNIGNSNNNRKRKISNCPMYLDKILVNGHEYVKLFVEDNRILICEYRKEGMLRLRYIPLNTMYIIRGVVKQDEMLSFLSRIDFNSMKKVNDSSLEKIKGMKLSLRK